jgi:hypothetical protein
VPFEINRLDQRRENLGIVESSGFERLLASGVFDGISERDTEVSIGFAREDGIRGGPVISDEVVT